MPAKLFAKKLIKFAIIGAALTGIFIAITPKALASAATGINSVYEPIIQMVWQIGAMLLAGAAYVLATSRILQWIIVRPDLINFDSPLVKTGLDFSYAFSNMLLIIAFLAIALGFIFKIETFQSKKALPKFIAVAILSQFAPVFVKMIVDIATVINNTLIAGSGSTIVTTFDLLINSMVQSISTIWIFIVTQAAKSILPAIASDAAMGIAITYFITGMLPVLPVYLAQFAVSFSIGGILLIYIIFFLSRVYILQFIAIVSPLVTVALALPQTSHFFKSVFSALIKWTFVGTMVLFLLVIGLRSSSSIMPDSSIDYKSTAYGIEFEIQGYLAYYLFLFIYMSTVAFIVEQNMPVMANFMKTSFAGLGAMVTARAITPTIGSLQQRMGSYSANLQQQGAAATGVTGGLTRLAAFGTGFAATGLGNMTNAFKAKGGDIAPAETTPITKYTPSGKVAEAQKRLGITDKTPINQALGGEINSANFNRQDEATQAAFFETYANKLDELKSALGDTVYRKSIDTLAANKMLSSETLGKALAADPGMMQNVIANPKDYQAITNQLLPATKALDENGKQILKALKDAKDAGETENPEQFAIKTALAKTLAESSPEKLKDLKIDQLVINPKTGDLDTQFMRAIAMKAKDGKQLRNVVMAMKPEQQKEWNEWRNGEDSGWLATNAPVALGGTKGMDQGFTPHPDIPLVKQGKGKGKPISANSTDWKDFIIEKKQEYKFASGKKADLSAVGADGSGEPYRYDDIGTRRTTNSANQTGTTDDIGTPRTTTTGRQVRTGEMPDESWTGPELKPHPNDTPDVARKKTELRSELLERRERERRERADRERGRV